MCAAGCTQTDAPVADHSVSIEVNAPTARIKIVDEMPVGEAIVALATKSNLNAGIPESVQGEFFSALPGAKGFERTTLDSAGTVKLQKLRGQHFVVARTDRSLWVVSASDTRDGRLVLGSENVGGLHAVDAALARTNIVQMLTSAAHVALTRRQFALARSLAQSARAASQLTQINRMEAYSLLAQSEEAFSRGEYDAARDLAKQADSIVPDLEQTQKLLTRIFDEVGGEVRSFEGHGGPVTSVAFSPDGTQALSGSADRTLKLWDVATGQEARTFTGHRDGVMTAVFSHDGRFIASGGNDSTVRLWDVASGQELRSAGGLGWKINSVAFSPDGNFLATAGEDIQVKLWSLPSLGIVRSFTGHGWKLTSVVFCPDGNTLLSGSEDNSSKLWEVATGNNLRTFQSGLTPVTCVAVSADGRLALTGGKDNTITLWRLSDGRELYALRGHTQSVRSVAFGPDGRFAVSGSDDGTVRLWDLATGKEWRTFTGHGGAVNSVAASPDGRFVLSGGADATLRLWRLPHGIRPVTEEARK